MRSFDPIYFAPQRKLGGGWICWKDSPSPPPAPDYSGAAKATSQGSIQAALANNLMAHPNITSPLGSQTWSAGPNVSVPAVGGQAGFDLPTYNQNVTLSPDQQNLYDRQMGLSKGLLGLGQSSLDQTQTSLSKPQDMQSVQDIADQSYGMQTARLDPQWAHNSEMQDAQLANQGITQGSEAYDNAQRTFGQQKNDAYNQARLSSIATMPQTFQLSSAERMQPLTELNAIRTGAQPQMPQFQPSQYSMGAQGPNMLAAAQGQNQYDMGLYNSQVGTQNSEMSGIMGLGGALGSAYLRSDRRLKSNIVRLGTHPLGIGIYEYDIDGRRDIGLMADEVLTVRPEAVARGPDGFLMINYRGL